MIPRRRKMSPLTSIILVPDTRTTGGGPNSPTVKNSSTSKFPSFGPTNQAGYGEDYAKQSSIGQQQSNTGAMTDRATKALDSPPRAKKTKSGLGGFLQRLASFRLGVKKGQEQKDKLKRKTQGNGTTTTTNGKSFCFYV